MAGTSRDRPSLPGPNIWQVVGVHCLPSPTLPPAESVNPIVPKSFRAGGGQWREEETSAGQLSGGTETPRCTTVVIVRREECKSEGQKGSLSFFPSLKTEHIDPQTETVHRDGPRIDSHIHRDCDTRDGAARHELGRGSWRWGRDVEGRTQTLTHRQKQHRTNRQLAGAAFFAGWLVVADRAARCSRLVLHTGFRCVQVQTANTCMHTGMDAERTDLQMNPQTVWLVICKSLRSKPDMNILINWTKLWFSVLHNNYMSTSPKA